MLNFFVYLYVRGRARLREVSVYVYAVSYLCIALFHLLNDLIEFYESSMNIRHWRMFSPLKSVTNLEMN